MIDSETNEWKQHRAVEAHKHRLNGNLEPFYRVQHRGDVPMYHVGFYLYLRWMLGALPPLQNTPMHGTEGEPYNDHVRYFGRPKEHYEAVPFLADLLDQTFVQLFGCQATVEDYNYVVELINTEYSKLADIPQPMLEAISWLNRQIERLNASRIKSALLDANRVPSDLPDELITTVQVYNKDYLSNQAEVKKVDSPVLWDELLNNYNLVKLNKLLVFVGLLDTTEPPTVARGTKPGQWVAVVAALEKVGRTNATRAALYRAFYQTYGRNVGSLRSFQNPYNEANELSSIHYTRALIHLGQS